MFVADALMDFQRIFGSPCQLTVYSGYSRSSASKKYARYIFITYYVAAVKHFRGENPKRCPLGGFLIRF